MLTFIISNLKIINVIRNPRDVCVSYMNHLRIIYNYVGSFETLVDVFTRDLGPARSPFFKHLLSFWNRRQDASNLLIVHYEEMKKDLPGVIRKVASFLDVTINEEDIPRLCNHLSFDEMKVNPMVNYESRVEVSIANTSEK